jgi:hypothetical protein
VASLSAFADIGQELAEIRVQDEEEDDEDAADLGETVILKEESGSL